MKEIIRRILKEEYKKMSSLPRNIIISIYDDMNISLYDFVNGEILGFVGLSRNKDGTYYFPMIAAEKGFGPTVLEVALMFCHPNGLMISRDGDIRGDAFNVWEKMYKRKDVIKETLPLSDKNFNFAIITGDDQETYESEFEKISEFEYFIEDGFKENILIYNSKMSIVPTKDYERLISDGSLLDHHEIYLNGRDFFTLKYNN
jgi:hypothetical protein